MTVEELNQISDAIMGPILEKMAPDKRRKLLLVMRKLSHPNAYPWIDAQLRLLEQTGQA